MATKSKVKTLDELPPIPEPGQPPEQILAALVAWTGGVHSAIGLLAADIKCTLSMDYLSDEEYEQIEPLLETLHEWAWDEASDELLDERIRSAVIRHGYSARKSAAESR